MSSKYSYDRRVDLTALAQPILDYQRDLLQTRSRFESAYIKLNRAWAKLAPPLSKNPQPQEWEKINAQALPQTKKLYLEAKSDISRILPVVAKFLTEVKKAGADQSDPRAYKAAKDMLARFKKPLRIDDEGDAWEYASTWQGMTTNYAMEIGHNVEILVKALEQEEKNVQREQEKAPPPPPAVPPQDPGPSDTVWSVAVTGRSHSYVTEADYFDSKSDAEREARDRGDCYVVKGTQMWNEPLGQVEEHDRTAPYKYFR